MFRKREKKIKSKCHVDQQIIEQFFKTFYYTLNFMYKFASP